MPIVNEVPAAHSVDSEWYAIDSTGEVARFVTGEAGAIPERAGVVGGEAGSPESERAVAVLQALAFALAREAEAAGLRPPTEFSEDWETASRDDALSTEWRCRLLARFDAPPPADARLEVLHHGKWWWALTPPLKRPERPAVVAGASLVLIPTTEPEEAGLTTYGNDDYDAAGSYMRTSRDKPITTGDLPPDVAEQVAHLALPLRFAEQEHVQLADLPNVGTLETWGETPLRAGEAPPKRPKPRGAAILVPLVVALAGLAWWASRC